MTYTFEDHLHNFAVWTSARAVQRGFTTTKNIKEVIEQTQLRAFAWNCDVYSESEFDTRPFIVKLLEEGKIEFTKVGKHRRVKVEDVLRYKRQMKEEQKKHLIDIMNFDGEMGLYGLPKAKISPQYELKR